jgi:uncharacterized membrane protein
MTKNTNPSNEQTEGSTFSSRLFGLLMLGFLLVFVGVIVLVAAAVFSSGGSASVGGVVFIGPFPIVFGAGPDSSWLIVISIVLAVVTLAFFVIYTRRAKRVMG